jgi:hypothetical protein
MCCSSFVLSLYGYCLVVSKMYSLPPAATTIQLPCKAKNAPKRPSIKVSGGEARIDPPPQQQSNQGDIERQIAFLKGEKQPPQPDGGRNAWIFLAGCSLFEALIWGTYSMSTIPTNEEC